MRDSEYSYAVWTWSVKFRSELHEGGLVRGMVAGESVITRRDSSVVNYIYFTR